MPFGDEDVQINYRAVVTGMQDVDALRNQTQGIQGDTQNYTNKINEATVAHTKNKNALLQAHTELRQFRRELFLAGFAIGIVTMSLSAMAKGSESAQIGFEKLTTGVSTFLGNVATWSAKTTAFWGAISGGASIDAAHKIAEAQVDEAQSIKTTIELLNLKAQTAKITGDEQLAIALKYDAAVKALDLEPNKIKASKVEFELEMQRMKEEANLRLNQKVKDLNYEAQTESLRGNDLQALHMKQEAENTQILLEGNVARRKIRQADADARHAEEERDLELTTLGLKRQSQIYKDYVKDVVSGTQKTSSDVLFKFLQGEKQSWKDVLKSFQAMFNRAFSDAITNSIMTSMTGKGGTGGFFSNLFGKKPTDSLASSILGKESPVESNARLANDLSSRSLDNERTMIALLSQIAECTCSAAKSTGGIMTATINPGKTSTLSKIGSVLGPIGSLVGAFSGFGGGVGAGSAVPQIPADIKMDPSLFTPKFPSGGEVPIMAQPGEFIVRKSASQDNKDLLKSVNMGARQSKSGQNVYFITANDAKSFADMLSSPSAQQTMEMQITKAIMSNGSLRNAIRSYGG